MMFGNETMASHPWMFSDLATRTPARRTRGRRATDRRPSLEAFLIAGVFIAWGWGAFQLAQLFVH
jgi:hypothetical protein